jgi:hypothetical protein
MIARLKLNLQHNKAIVFSAPVPIERMPIILPSPTPPPALSYYEIRTLLALLAWAAWH